MNRTAIAIRHLSFEDLGCFEETLYRRGLTPSYRDAGVDEIRAVELADADLLFVLGGPISVNEGDTYPFLADEIAVLRKRLADDRPTFGICLGAQLMAVALGAAVYPSGRPEIGFAPLTLSAAGRACCLSVFADAPVLHWHGESCALPQGAVALASTSICPVQAFSYRRNALAVQFHPEAGVEGFERWLIGHTLELARAGVDIANLRAEHETLRTDLKRRADACLGGWLDEIGL